ncbi:hypothetical protein QQP08_014712 [Theobroma cacao]|nr:hypothetical protein QQP08_014712 [Theobroma cacao]
MNYIVGSWSLGLVRSVQYIFSVASIRPCEVGSSFVGSKLPYHCFLCSASKATENIHVENMLEFSSSEEFGLTCLGIFSCN